MTDFKPGNTLYNATSRRALLIDLGGVQKAKNKEELENFEISKFTGQYTFRAPELEKKEIGKQVNLLKCLSFICGKTIS